MRPQPPIGQQIVRQSRAHRARAREADSTSASICRGAHRVCAREVFKWTICPPVSGAYRVCAREVLVGGQVVR